MSNSKKIQTENVFFKYLQKKATTDDQIEKVLKIFGIHSDTILQGGSLADALEIHLKDRHITVDEIVALTNSIPGVSVLRLVDENSKEMLRRIGKVIKIKPSTAKPTADTKTHSQTPAYKATVVEQASSSAVKRRL